MVGRGCEELRATEDSGGTGRSGGSYAAALSGSAFPPVNTAAGYARLPKRALWCWGRGTIPSPSSGGRPPQISDQRFFRLRVEEVKAPHVHAERDQVADAHLHLRVDAGDHVVAADLAVQELVGAQDL